MQIHVLIGEREYGAHVLFNDNWICMKSILSTNDFLYNTGNICSAQYSIDDCWYRSLVISAEEESQIVKVFFIDFGNSEDVPIKR